MLITRARLSEQDIVNGKHIFDGTREKKFRRHSLYMVWVKKDKIFSFLVLILSMPLCYGQTGNCELIFASTTSKEDLVINRDTIFFENNSKLKLYLMNDRIYANNKVIYKFKKVGWYAEISYVKIDSLKYIYVFPIHKGESGPYIWSSTNGVAIQVTALLPIKEDIPYSDFFDICTLNIESYFQEEDKKN
jgi:hypothetical protein